MDDKKRPPIALLMLPLVALGAMLAVQYFAPPTAQTEEPAAVETAQPAAGAQTDAAKETTAPAQLSPSDAHSRATSQQTYRLENDRFAAEFTDLNTAMVSLSVKGDRYLDAEGKPFELVTTD